MHTSTLNKETIILVDKQDQEVGYMEKHEAHRKGLLHRAFSVFIFNDKNELMLHQRASGKYHSGGLWTNTCCSHPRIGESVEDAANRRLHEEMGFECPLEFQFSFIYRSELNNNMVEHEYDHVFFGYYNQDPVPNPEEVQDWGFKSMDSIALELKEQPDKYTAWFKVIFENVYEQLKLKRA